MSILSRLLVSTIALGCLHPGPAQGAGLPDSSVLQSWIAEMKTSPKGPFQAIRWFCADGSVQPPKAFACADHGGGIQHGLWSQRAQQLRENGYLIGNLLAGVQADDFTGPDAQLDWLKQILIERFLMQADDGWIMRGALSYRGAFQLEDEIAGASRALEAMAADSAWRDPSRFELFRESVRLFPHESDSATASAVRQLAVVIADKDPGFAKLRAKIHNAPDAADAQRVRRYAQASGKPALADQYAEISGYIEALYGERGVPDALDAIAERTDDESTARKLRSIAAELRGSHDAADRFRIASRTLRELRDRVPAAPADAVVPLLRASIAVEGEAFASASRLVATVDRATRLEQLRWLADASQALYGSGLLSWRLATELRDSIQRIGAGPIDVDRYREELRYLARAPEWASRWLAFLFSVPLEQVAQLDHLAELYPQDRLRASPLLFYSSVIDGLALDANRLAGIEHELFGQRIGAGLRALNPGLARGVLRTDTSAELERDGIYLLPETVSDLPRIAGILTLGEGSSLSHVQLLARNMGIPNVVVGDELLPRVRERKGAAVVLAVSPNGVVRLALDGPQWDAIFGTAAAAGTELVIKPDLEKLDLEHSAMVPITELRAVDSGRSSGPKGANLGELAHHFGDRVPPGFVIPFAAFRKVLDQPIEPGGPSVFEWMKERYDTIQSQAGDPALQEKTTRAFLAKLRHWIETCDPGPEFRAQLHTALETQFGPDGTYGAFVRSDTNVEDLPGFTGAGLNLTLPNIVGEQNILDAIRQVWASPFEDRAYGWRQGNMEDPEYVFPAVVIQYSFPSEKSGVMVTADVETGSRDILSVAVSEGVGGAVEGQAAESLRIDAKTGAVRIDAPATAPMRTALPLTGGVEKVPASGTDAVLKPGEIAQLVELANDVSRFPSLLDENGELLPADIEFGFKDGELALLQIRPFVESKGAQRNAYLAELDAGFRQRGEALVDLFGVPGSAGPAAPASPPAAR